MAVEDLTGLPAPLAVWDANAQGGLFWSNWHDCTGWAKAHMPRADDTYRAEFYLVDAPFMVLYRYARNEYGRTFSDLYGDAAEPAAEMPATVMLSALPPARLLGSGLPSQS